MKNVLIPTDFSKSAELAAKYGVEIAKQLNSGVTFLHIISTPVEWKKIPLEKESLYPETKAAIGSAKDALFKLERMAENQGVDACTSLIFNTGIEEIPKYISKNSYNLVVMGTHGQKGIDKVMGTNTLKVINRSTVPVLAVKLTDRHSLPKNWVLVSDFQDESREKFETLLELAQGLQAHIQVLYVNTPYYFLESGDIQDKMEGFLSTMPKDRVKRNIINARNEERGIENFLKSCECDLVAVVTHGRSGLLPLFRRSMSERLINHLTIPVLSLNT
ncbi:Nucleotide-binding universal stress protein, UspA family [Salinimicrobium catena]|uniref:Nucleotide-binding universal stress protein, UspA family n=1 Tax=Salinimicrobium catena TaxID=390640 RepID=A0A1H5GXI6_9FLAO|nr:universal stress protein [Salinimicrobium catena]SDK66373.1 Nucleotide-binding universal stress protein, UspA family [Salinimicrobium catena]SEE20387.1 Nucleotide-binding universal stress protein, UspA family [Salinimicrobium catena]